MALPHLWKQYVLLHREPEFALPVDARKASELGELIPRDPPHRDQAAHDAPPRLFLPRHADVVTTVAHGRSLARPRQWPPHPLDDGLTEAFQPPLLQEHLQA